jgi:hypothetical protein
MQAAVDAGFAAFGTEATYTPPGGAPVPCTIIVNAPDRVVSFGDNRPFAEGTLLDVRASEIAAPVKAGVFAYSDSFGAPVSVSVLGDPELRDPERLVWTCRVG